MIVNVELYSFFRFPISQGKKSVSSCLCLCRWGGGGGIRVKVWRVAMKKLEARDIAEKTHVLMNHVESRAKVTQFSSLPSKSPSPKNETAQNSINLLFIVFEEPFRQKVDEQLKV